MKILQFFFIFFLLSPYSADAHSNKKNVKGALIGAGAGLVLGGTVGYLMAPACEEQENKCRWQIPIFTGSVAAGFGGLFGWLIADNYLEEEKVVFVPIIKETAYGFGFIGTY